MLNQRQDTRRNDTIIRSLTDEPQYNTKLLGCSTCPDHALCGGLSVKDSLFDCLGLCCGDNSHCTRVCPNNIERYVSQKREIVGFDLENVPRVPPRKIDLSNDVVQLIYHGSSRSSSLAKQWIALRLSDLVNFQKKEVRFNSREQLCNAYRIDLESEIILSGVDHDHRIEPWWGLGAQRLGIIRKLIGLGIRLVSSPNFSLLLDNPRTDDLHAIKRIGLVFAEFQQEGLPCALHPNGRTNKDFERWAKFIADRPEIGVLAYEFITGPGRKERKQFHLESLAYLAERAGRKLDIIVRGDPNVIPFLRKFYRSVVYIDTTAFMKTIKRQLAERTTNRTLEWKPKKTVPAELLDGHIEHNISEQVAYLKATFYDETI